MINFSSIEILLVGQFWEKHCFGSCMHDAKDDDDDGDVCFCNIPKLGKLWKGLLILLHLLL